MDSQRNVTSNEQVPGRMLVALRDGPLLVSELRERLKVDGAVALITIYRHLGFLRQDGLISTTDTGIPIGSSGRTLIRVALTQLGRDVVDALGDGLDGVAG